jgi:hypothetical protein
MAYDGVGVGLSDTTMFTHDAIDYLLLQNARNMLPVHSPQTQLKRLSMEPIDQYCLKTGRYYA